MSAHVLHRCKHCTWWVPIAAPYYSDLPLADRGMCLKTEVSGSRGPNDPASKAFAQDGSGYWAWLVTAPDFGCVQWEPTRETGTEARVH